MTRRLALLALVVLAAVLARRYRQAARSVARSSSCANQEWVAKAVWEKLEREPGFSERLNAAIERMDGTHAEGRHIAAGCPRCDRIRRVTWPDNIEWTDERIARRAGG